MRVLVIDKTAGLDASHERHQAMAGEDGVELHVLGPRHWVENGRDIIWRPPIDARYQAHRGRVVGKGHYARVWYINGMASAMRQSKPDIIQLLEEPWSLTALQTMLYAPLFAPHAKILFYTWENIYRPWTYPARASCLYAMIDKAMHSRSCAAVCATEGARQVLDQKGYAKPFAVVPYGIPHYFFDDQPEPSPRKSFTIGYVGRMLEMKGVDLLIQAVAQIPDAQLRLVGTGDDFASIQSLCKQLHVADRVEWIAALTEREVPAFMSELDVLVLPSRSTPGWMEQLGRVLIEAMAIGTPVIGARSGAIPEVIGDAGLLFNADDSDDLALQLQCVKANKDLRTECRRRGRLRAQTQFTWPHFAKQMLHFYRSLSAESKSTNE
ncbi:MAG: glycosyltransferase [Candidatus Hinthialibacter antarcticus]|nr:glycosyltransferase [Candidatus Hinthialibacter antarcticus]